MQMTLYSVILKWSLHVQMILKRIRSSEMVSFLSFLSFLSSVVAGVPNIGPQRVMAQLGAIGLTIEFIDSLLCDPPSALDDDPGRGVPSACITDYNSNRAISLLFRFLRQIVKANKVRAHVALLEEHVEFLYKHLNSDYKVVICSVSVYSDLFFTFCGFIWFSVALYLTKYILHA
jgi:hypothetical protein